MMIKLDEKTLGLNDPYYFKKLEEGLNKSLHFVPFKINVEEKHKGLILKYSKVKKVLSLKNKIPPNWIISFIDLNFISQYPCFSVSKEINSDNFDTIEKYFNIEEYENRSIDYATAVKEYGVDKALQLIHDKESIYFRHKIIVDRLYLTYDKFRVKILSQRKVDNVYDIRYYNVSTVKHEPVSQFLTDIRSTRVNDDIFDRFITCTDNTGIVQPRIPIIKQQLVDFMYLFATELLKDYMFINNINLNSSIKFENIANTTNESIEIGDWKFESSSNFEISEAVNILKNKFEDLKKTIGE